MPTRGRRRKAKLKLAQTACILHPIRARLPIEHGAQVPRIQVMAQAQVNVHAPKPALALIRRALLFRKGACAEVQASFFFGAPEAEHNPGAEKLPQANTRQRIAFLLREGLPCPTMGQARAMPKMKKAAVFLHDAAASLAARELAEQKLGVRAMCQTQHTFSACAAAHAVAAQAESRKGKFAVQPLRLGIVQRLIHEHDRLSACASQKQQSDAKKPSAHGGRRIKAMRVLVASDAWKGTLAPGEAARALAQGIAAGLPSAQVDALGIADGGEGTLAVLQEARVLRCTGALGWDAQGGAWLESARVVGWADPRMRARPLHARGTQALGRLLRDVLARGAQRVHLALGGTATLDFGLGLLLALGAKAWDAQGRPVPPTLAGALACRSFQPPALHGQGVEIVALCDVDAPLFGPAGAVQRFGPQKGLAEAEVPHVETQGRRFADLVEAAFGRRARMRAGAGAAGGLGWALALLGARLVSGAEQVLHALNFAARVRGADWVVVAEGRADRQTLQGKAPWWAARMAKRAGVRIALVAAEVQAREAFLPHVDCIWDFRDAGIAREEGLARPKQALVRLGRRLAEAVLQSA